MFDYITKKEALVLCNNYYKNMTNINNSYNLIYECSKVDIFSSNLNKICTKDTCNDYNTITYDTRKKVFYVTKLGSKDLIYVLDSNYIEIDIFTINGPIQYLNYINDIYYDCIENLIYVVTSCHVYAINTSGMIVDVCFDINNLCLCDKEYTNAYLSAVYKGHDFYYIGYTVNNSTYIGVVSKYGNLINKIYIEDCVVVNSIVKINCKLNLLVTKKNQYSYIYYTSIKCCTDNNCMTNNIIKNAADENKKCAYLIDDISKCLSTEIKKNKCIDELIKFNNKASNMINDITGLEKTILNNMNRN